MISISPQLIIHNNLPISLKFSTPEEDGGETGTLQSSESFHIYSKCISTDEIKGSFLPVGLKVPVSPTQFVRLLDFIPTRHRLMGSGEKKEVLKREDTVSFMDRKVNCMFKASLELDETSSNQKEITVSAENFIENLTGDDISVSPSKSTVGMIIPKTFNSPLPFNSDSLFVNARDSAWSKEQKLEKVGTSATVVPFRLEGNSPHDYFLSWHQCSLARSQRSFRICPMFVVNNNTSFPIQIGFSTDISPRKFSIGPGESSPVHRQTVESKKGPANIVLSVSGFKGFEVPLDTAEVFPFTLTPNENEDEAERRRIVPRFLAVEINLVNNSTMITFQENVHGYAMVLIKNHTTVPFNVKQSEDDFITIAYARKGVSFSWTSLTKPRTIDILPITTNPGKLGSEAKNMKIMQKMQAKKYAIGDKDVYIDVELSGHTRTVHIRPSLKTNSPAGHIVMFCYSVKIPEVLFSLVDNSFKELALLAVEQISTDCIVTNEKTTVRFAIKGVQLDNSIPAASVPVIASTETRAGSETSQFLSVELCILNSNNQERLNGSKKFVEKSNASLVYIPALSFNFTPLEVTIEAAFLESFLEYISSMMEIMNSTDNDKKDDQAHVLVSKITGSKIDSEDEELSLELKQESSVIFIERFFISEVLFIVNMPSFETTSKGTLFKFLKAMGPLVKLSGAPIQFDTLLIHDVEGTIGTISRRLLLHYGETLNRIIARIIFSTELTGNPVGMFHDFKTGARALKENDVGSFFKHSTAAVSNSAGTIFSAIGSGLIQVSGGEMHSSETGPQGFKDSVKQGAKDLGLGFVEGFTGIVKAPQKGLRENGAKGLGLGILQGVSGIVARPAAGVFKFVGSIGKGIHGEVVGAHKALPMRYTRYLPSSRNIVPYDGVLSFYQYLCWKGHDDIDFLQDYLLLEKEGTSSLLLIVTVNYTLLCFNVFKKSSAERKLKFRRGQLELKGKDLVFQEIEELPQMDYPDIREQVRNFLENLYSEITRSNNESKKNSQYIL